MKRNSFGSLNDGGAGSAGPKCAAITRVKAHSRRASVRTATADTIARRKVASVGRCRFPMCRTADTAITARASSTRRPKVRSARSLRLRKPSRSAGAGSCIRPAVRRYGDKARSTRVPVAAAIARRRVRSAHIGQTMSAVHVSSRPRFFDF